MRGTLAIRIVVPLLAFVGVVCALVFDWTSPSDQVATPPMPRVQNRPEVKPEAAGAGPSTQAPDSAAVAAAIETLKSLGTPIDSQTNLNDSSPGFDVARIEPNGEAVIAGHAAPGATVELLRGGEVHDRTVVDRSGAFVLVPKPLPPGTYDLTLRATLPNGKTSVSQDSVAVAIGASKVEQPVVALVAPDKPVVVLSKPVTEPAASLAIDAVESETGGRLYVSGRSTPGANVRLYLNEAHVASAIASGEGRVGFAIRSGVKPGGYRVRLDQVDASGHVQSRAEVNFNAPAAVDTAAVSPSPGAKSPPAPSPEATISTSPSFAAPGAAETALSSSAAGPASASPKETAFAAPKVPPLTAPAPAATAAPMASTAPTPGEPAQSVANTPRPAPAPDLTASAPANPSTSTGQTGQQSQQVAAGTEPASPPHAAEPGDPSVVVVPRIESTVVVRGDSLWRISRTAYGRGARYSVIYAANRDQIRNPNLIYPGQIFVLPQADQ
jgi:nucleoid-associated protein YgaU